MRPQFIDKQFSSYGCYGDKEWTTSELSNHMPVCPSDVL